VGRDRGEVGVEGAGGLVPGEDVEAFAENEGGNLGELAEQAEQGGACPLGGPAAAGALVGAAGEFVEVVLLVVVQAQGADEGDQDGTGGADAALFEAGVVVDADRGELGDLLAAQSGDPAGGRPFRAGRTPAGSAVPDAPARRRRGGNEIPDSCSPVSRTHLDGDICMRGQVSSQAETCLFSSR